MRYATNRCPAWYRARALPEYRSNAWQLPLENKKDRVILNRVRLEYLRVSRSTPSVPPSIPYYHPSTLVYTLDTR
jgi:hypothetical protein